MFWLCNICSFFYYGFLPCNKGIFQSRVTSTLAAPSSLLHRSNSTTKFSRSLREESDNKFSYTKSLTTRLRFLHLLHSLIMQPLSPAQEYSLTIASGLVGTSFPLVIALLRPFLRSDAFSQTSQRQLLCGIFLLNMYSLWALIYW